MIGLLVGYKAYEEDSKTENLVMVGIVLGLFYGLLYTILVLLGMTVGSTMLETLFGDIELTTWIFPIGFFIAGIMQGLVEVFVGAFANYFGGWASKVELE